MEPSDEFASIHDAYQHCGPSGFYQSCGRNYRNPHEPIIAQLIDGIARDRLIDLNHVLDLAAGSGEVTLAVRAVDPAARIDAIDPYTGEAYQARTGGNCVSMTFENIAQGALRDREYSIIICSFALHLLDEARLPNLCWELAGISRQLMILTPHKRPVIKESWGWALAHERLVQRVRGRVYHRVAV